MHDNFESPIREVKKDKAHTCPSAENMGNHVARLKEHAENMVTRTEVSPSQHKQCQGIA